MATLSGNKIKNTYQALVKFSDNGNITTSAKQLTDGFGNNSPMWVSTTQVGIGVTPEAGLNLHVYGDAKIGSNLTVIGNLVVEGSTTTVGTDTLTVKDPLIVLANNNTSTDAVDIGFYGKYAPAGTTLYSGLFREALTGKYRLFKGLQIEPTTTVSVSGTGYDKADLVIGNIETNGVVEDSSLFTFSKDVIINKAGTTKLTIDNVTQNKSIELECTSLNNVLNAEGDMIFSSGSPIFKYTSSSFEVISVDSTFGGDIIANGDITLSNSSKIKWNGTSALEIYDDGTNAIKIETGSSRILDVCSDIFQLKAGDTNNNDLMLTHGSEGVSIYYRGNTNPGVKFATTSDGVDVTGELAVSGTGQSSFGGQVTIPLTPTSSTDAASKGYVDTQVGANNELSEVLANGNITDGTDIVVSTGDQILLPDGNSTNPAITFSGDTNTGMYRTGSDVLNLGVGGSDAISMFPNTVYIKPAGSTELTISTTGSTFAGDVDVNGNLDVTSTASDAVFLRSSQATTTNVYITNTNATSNNTANLYFAPANNIGGSYIKSTAIEDFSSSANRTADLRFAVRKDGTFNEAVIIDSDGNVGINNNLPTAKLTIDNSIATAYSTTSYASTPANSMLYLNNTNGGSNTASLINFRTGSGDGVLGFVAGGGINDADFVIQTDGGVNGIERFRITNAGNVGIGTDSPIGNLNINGGTGDAAAQDAIETFTRTSSTGNVLAAKLRLVDGSATTHGDLKFQVKTTASSAENDAYYTDAITIKGNNANVGIGTTSPSGKVDILGLDLNIGADNGAPTTRTNSTVKVGVITSPHYTTAEENFTGMLLIGNTTANEVILGGGTSTYNSATQIKFYTGANSTTVTGTERMRIDSSGKVGIGTTSPSDKLTLDSGQMRLSDNYGIRWGSASTAIYGSSGAGTLQIFTNSAERMRITSGGDVDIAPVSGSSVIDYGMTVAPQSGYAQIYLRANTTSTTYLQRFYNESSGVLQNVGNIVISGSSTNYVTTSDYRLKEDLQDFAGLDMVSKISVYDFKWKRDESRSYGVMAHELQEVLPQAVVGEKDAEEMQSVDYSKIVPLLVKSIQELTAKVDKLEQECKCKN